MRYYTAKEVAKILVVSKERIRYLMKNEFLKPDKADVTEGGRIRYYFSEKVIKDYAEKIGIECYFDRADNADDKKPEYQESGLWIITIDRGYLDRNTYLKHHALGVTNNIKYTYMFDNHEEAQKIVDVYGVGRVECLYILK